MDVSVTVEAERKGKQTLYLVKLQGEVFEANIRIQASEVHELALVASSRWEDGSMQIGEAADAPVFWSTEDDITTILIGADDENWDIALTVPVTIMNAIIEAIAKA